MPTVDLQAIVNGLVTLAYGALPVIATLIGLAARKWMAAHASLAQQEQLATLAFAVVSSVEQQFKGASGQARFTAADLALKNAAPSLNDAQRNTLIHTAVRTLNAGVIALAPHTAALLTPDTASAAPGVNAQAITDSAVQAASSAIDAQVPGAIQRALQTFLAPLAGIFTAPSTAATPPFAPSAPAPVTGQAASVPVSGIVQTPADGAVRLTGTLTKSTPTRASTPKAPAVPSAASTSASSVPVDVMMTPATPAPASVTATPPSDEVTLVQGTTAQTVPASSTSQ